MRRFGLMLACVAVLLVAGTSSAFAGGYHHGHGYYGHQNYGYRPWNAGYRGGFGPGCAVSPRITNYGAYAAPYYSYGYAPAPQFGFGLGGQNFSLFYQQ